MSKKIKMFVSENFDVPEKFITPNFHLEKLSPKVAEFDYEAVMTSKERLRQVFQENDTWPKDDMTLEENIKDLERHEKEFNNREAFAYTVLSLDKKKCIGCVYIDPPTNDDWDCEIYMWVRDDEVDLDNVLFNTIKNWIKSEWPFNKIMYPGREHSWTARNELKKS